MSSDKRRELQELLQRLEGGGTREETSKTSSTSECCDVKYRWVQVAYRMLVNVDALNMVESVGNVTRRRTIPVIVPKAPGNYVVRWVPAVSGEALAHRYQLEIVELAKSKYTACSDRIDYWSEQGELLKHWDLGFYAEQCRRAKQKQAPEPKDWECELADKYAGKQEFSIDDLNDIEKTIVDKSIVEDIGGFLVTQGPTRRTSCIRFSYLIPTLDAIEASQLDHQMHVRGALKAQSLRLPGYTEAIQVPYYVQTGSVLYGGNIELDLCCVGSYSIASGCTSDQKCTLALRRCIAVEALRPILEGDFGAKRSRYRPHNVLETAIVVLSDKPLPLPPATLPLKGFREELRKKLEAYRKLGVETRVIAYLTKALGDRYYDELRKELIEELGEVEVYETVPEFLEAIEKAVGLKCG